MTVSDWIRYEVFCRKNDPWISGTAEERGYPSKLQEKPRWNDQSIWDKRYVSRCVKFSNRYDGMEKQTLFSCSFIFGNVTRRAGNLYSKCAGKSKWLQRRRKTGENRKINRQKFLLADIEKELQTDPLRTAVYGELTQMLSIRKRKSLPSE